MWTLILILSSVGLVQGWASLSRTSQRATHLGVAASPDTRYYSFLDAPFLTDSSKARVTLTRYLAQVVKDSPELRDLEWLLSVQKACITIANLVNRAGLNSDPEGRENFTDGRFYSMQRLDQLSTTVLKNALRFTGKVEVVAPRSCIDSESPARHQPGVLIAKSLDSNYVAVLDPLDGSGNADASICTGTVFGVFEKEDRESSSSTGSSGRTQELVESVLQPAKNMIAAGYCLYSSATVLVFAVGGSVQGFTLDPQMQEFVLTHPNLTIPKRGNVYSCNEGNSEGWDEKFKNYLRKLKTGQGESGQRYAHRYVGSMVGDIHRTLLYGGIFAYPSDPYHPDGNLQLLYKTAPMAYVVATAGGLALDGSCNDLLQVRPQRTHQKVPCYLGSSEDIVELMRHLKS